MKGSLVVSTAVGPHFKELSPTSQILLREWLRLARLYPPDTDELLPTDFTLALADLAREGRGKLLHGHRQSVTTNRGRSVRARKGVGVLAS